MYFVTPTSVRQQVRDEGVRSALTQQQRQGVGRLLRSELRARQGLEVARVADAQATMVPSMVGVVPSMVGVVHSMVGVADAQATMVPSMVGVVHSMVGVADAQATMLRWNSNLRARILLLEAETHAKILPEEGQERCRVTWEAGWAKRQREMSIWETSWRVALLGR